MFLNNGTITGYAATASPGVASCSTTTATLCGLTGLTDGTTYTVTVTGWNVTVSATTFTNGTVSLPNTGTFSTNGSITSAVAAAGPTAACTSGVTCTLPTDTPVTYPVALTTAATTPTAFKVYEALAATGLGSITIGLPGAAPVGWWVAVPGNAVPATYLSTVTLEVLSAP